MSEQQPINQESQWAEHEQNLRTLAAQGDVEACYQLVVYFENQFFSTEVDEAIDEAELIYRSDLDH